MDSLAKPQLDLEAVAVKVEDLQGIERRFGGQQKDRPTHRVMNNKQAHDAPHRFPQPIEHPKAHHHIGLTVEDMVVNNLRIRLVGFGRTGSLQIAGVARPIYRGTEHFPLAHDITAMSLAALSQQRVSMAHPAQ